MDEEKLGMHQGAPPELFRNAQELRKRLTEAEELLWEQLRNKRLDGYKFRCQHPIGKYIVDFYCHQNKLAIEIDGKYHEEEMQKIYDQLREKDLTESGIRVIRFTNEEVMDQLTETLERIRSALSSSPDH